MNYRVIVAAALAVVAAGAAYWQFRVQHAARDTSPPQPAAAAAPAQSAPAASAAPQPESYPIDGATSGDALPAPEHSDPVLGAVITKLIGQAAFTRWVRQEQIARRIVVTVDALGRDSPAFAQRLLRFVGGSFQVEGDEQHATIRPENTARYQPLMTLLGAADLDAMVREYRHLYPLLQNAYVSLGYPEGHFNDRLVEVIDLLLATPDAAPPVELRRPGVLYEYADPKLESLSTGQKILLRVGRDDATLIKQRLRELRALVTARP